MPRTDGLLVAAISVAVLAPLAGCAGASPTESAPGPEQSSATTGNQTADEQSANATTAHANETSTSRADIGDPEPRPVAFEGAYEEKTRVCATTCASVVVAPLDNEEQRFFPVETDRNVTALNLTMDWQPRSPAMEELRLGVHLDCEDGCNRTEWIDGPAPLSLSVEKLDTTNLTIWAWLPPVTPTRPYVYQSHTQSFEITGELALRIPPVEDTGE